MITWLLNGGEEGIKVGTSPHELDHGDLIRGDPLDSMYSNFYEERGPQGPLRVSMGRVTMVFRDNTPSGLRSRWTGSFRLVDSFPVCGVYPSFTDGDHSWRLPTVSGEGTQNT